MVGLGKDTGVMVSIRCREGREIRLKLMKTGSRTRVVNPGEENEGVRKNVGCKLKKKRGNGYSINSQVESNKNKYKQDYEN